MKGLEKLEATLAARKFSAPESSYTAKLLNQGIETCAKKFGEEAFELAMAAVMGNKPGTTNEAADVLYHLLVLLQSANITLADVMAVLEKREGTSGLVEKANRNG
jgi:phosphoribosyl-ATP pyrophosphohydrolase